MVEETCITTIGNIKETSDMNYTNDKLEEIIITEPNTKTHELTERIKTDYYGMCRITTRQTKIASIGSSIPQRPGIMKNVNKALVRIKVTSIEQTS